MLMFSYTAKNKDGEVIRDILEAESRHKALHELRKQGVTVVSLTQINADTMPRSENSSSESGSDRSPKGVPFWKQKISLIGSPRVKLKDMAVFCRQLAISVNSGLPLRDALEGIHDDMDVPAFKRVLGRILQRLHEGVAFSKAASEHPKVFSQVFVGLVRAAEESGSMGETLTRLAEYLESSDKLRRKIASMLAYPIFVAVFFVGICLLMVFWIVPQFQDIFSGLKGELPAFTQAVFAANNALINHAPLIGAVLVLIALAFYLFRRTSGGRLSLAKIQLSLPRVGECIKQYVIARVCRCLAIMLKSGVPIATGLQIVSRVGNNSAIEKSLIEAREKTVGGVNIADSLAGTGIFPSLLIRMVRVGEGAGRLPEVLDNVAETYEDRVENTITTAMALMEPVIIVVFGALVLMLVIAIYLPVMTVASGI